MKSTARRKNSRIILVYSAFLAFTVIMPNGFPCGLAVNTFEGSDLFPDVRFQLPMTSVGSLVIAALAGLLSSNSSLLRMRFGKLRPSDLIERKRADRLNYLNLRNQLAGASYARCLSLRLRVFPRSRISSSGLSDDVVPPSSNSLN
jgi:hypothetical protein